MKCKICDDMAKIKHHVKYFQEQTIGVCESCHGKIHSGKYPELEKKYIKYNRGDPKQYYEQKQRIEKITNRILRWR